MDTKTMIKRKRSPRTTREQLAYYRTFCKQHPILEAKTNYLEDSAIKQRLWKQLAEDLNNLKGPSRSVHVWTKMLSDWRNLMKSRDRKLRANREITDGGSSKIQIVAVEEEASQTFDCAAVDVCLGFDESQPENTDEFNYSFSPDIKIEPSSPVMNTETTLPSPVSKATPTLPSTSVKAESSSPLPTTPPLSSPLPSDNEWMPSMSDKQPNTRRNRNLKHNRLDQLYTLLINNMAAEQKRMAVDNQQHKMLLASNLAVQHALEKMANAFTTLAEAVTKNINNK